MIGQELEQGQGQGQGDLDSLLARVARLEREIERLNAEIRVYQQVLAASDDAVVVSDPELITTCWSPGAERLLGWSAREMTGRRAWDVLETEVVGDELRDVLTKLQEQGEYRGHALQTRKDGSRVRVEARIVSVHDGARATGFVSTYRRAPEPERMSAEHHRLVLESISDLVFSFDSEWRFTSVNEAFERSVQMSRHQLLGKRFQDAFPGVEETGFFSTYQRVMESHEPATYVDEYSFADGRVGAYQVRVAPIPDGLLITAVDITHHKQAEARLGWMAKVFLEATDPIIIGDAAGIVTEINEEALRIYGWSREDIVGRSVKLLVPDERHAQADELLARCTAGEQVRNEESARMTRSGEVIPVLLTLSALTDESGQVLGVVSLAKDITEQKRVEDSLRRARARLEQANAELETFAYSVSHDLRTPLRSMGGFSRVLLEKYSDRLDGKGRHYLERIRAGSQNMGQLIDGMLVLSRVSRAKMRHADVDLAEIARGLVATLKEGAPQRQVELVAPASIPVRGDRALLRALMQNLLGNAWKFTAREPVARIEVGTTEDGEHFIRDNGVGFDAKYADKLFGAFQRLHASNEFDGLGIGLATVLRIVRRHGGRVRAEGEPGRGATFYFTLE